MSNPWFWAWAIPACILTGISKSGLGGGVGGYTVPLMSMIPVLAPLPRRRAVAFFFTAATGSDT